MLRAINNHDEVVSGVALDAAQWYCYWRAVKGWTPCFEKIRPCRHGVCCSSACVQDPAELTFKKCIFGWLLVIPAA